MRRLFAVSVILTLSFFVYSQNETFVTLQPEDTGNIIPSELYGQFAEHLGTGIYGGIWVGKDSPIPNTDGYRNDVLNALRRLDVPVIRWPGGCFADYYHWKDGIGPQESRPEIVNALWGGTLEDNSFGTHEFLNLCELLGCEPYISANMGSGTVEEMSQWVDYMTADKGPMAKLRKENGREKPWDVKYFGVGNESWGCGGQMTAEHYSDLYRRYAEFCRKIGGSPLVKVASGATDYDYNWTEVLMQGIGQRMNAISVHYYTVLDWDVKGPARGFSDETYYRTIGKSLGIEPVLQQHIAIMDKYDAENKIGLYVDEWGTWWDSEPGSVDGHLYQQNTMRDAIVAAVSLDIFHKYAERVKMTNIAQMVNVLQAMILTKEDKMVLTPTYYIFDMYKVHREATFIPLEIATDTLAAADGRISAVPAISATASKDSTGVIHVSLTNTDLKKDRKVTIKLAESSNDNPSRKTRKRSATIAGTVLSSAKIDDCNTFEAPCTISPKEFTDAKMKNGIIEITIPAHSVVTISVL